MELFFIGAQLVLNIILIILVVVAYKASAKTSKKLSELNTIYIKNYKIFTEIVKLSFTRFKAETNNSLLLFNWDLDRKAERIGKLEESLTHDKKINPEDHSLEKERDLFKKIEE